MVMDVAIQEKTSVYERSLQKGKMVYANVAVGYNLSLFHQHQ